MNSFKKAVAICGLYLCLHAASAPAQGTEEARKFYQAGQIMFQKGAYELAREKWSKALDLDPNNADVRRDLDKVNKMLGIESGEKHFEIERTLDERRIGSHKIEIAPTTGTGGIQTGILMAYGHILRAPYSVERIEKRMSVNGVQVLPSLLEERKLKSNPWKPPERSPEDREKLLRRESVHKQAMQIYKNSWFAARWKILALLSRHPDLFSEVEVSDTGVEVHFKSFDTRVRQGWIFEHPSLASLDVLEQNGRNLREEQKGYIERDLRAGRFVAITSNGQSGPMNDPRVRVNAIMQNSALTREQRLSQLADIFNYGTALDILENYSDNEWATPK